MIDPLSHATFAELLGELRRPDAFQRLVDTLAEGRAKFCLQAWGLLNGHYLIGEPRPPSRAAAAAGGESSAHRADAPG